jgi:hypothetical protein
MGRVRDRIEAPPVVPFIFAIAPAWMDAIYALWGCPHAIGVASKAVPNVNFDTVNVIGRRFNS